MVETKESDSRAELLVNEDLLPNTARCGEEAEETMVRAVSEHKSQHRNEGSVHSIGLAEPGIRCYVSPRNNMPSPSRQNALSSLSLPAQYKPLELHSWSLCE